MVGLKAGKSKRANLNEKEPGLFRSAAPVCTFAPNAVRTASASGGNVFVAKYGPAGNCSGSNKSLPGLTKAPAAWA
jgi:hypothetical protein